MCSAVYLGCACTVPDVRIPAELRKFEKKVLFFGRHSMGENVGYCARALSSSYTTGCTAARVSALLLQARLSDTQSAAIGACASLACIDCCCFGAALTFVSMLCRLEKKRPLLFVSWQRTSQTLHSEPLTCVSQLCFFRSLHRRFSGLL